MSCLQAVLGICQKDRCPTKRGILFGCSKHALPMYRPAYIYQPDLVVFYRGSWVDQGIYIHWVYVSSRDRKNQGYKAFHSHDKLVVLDEDSKRNVYVYDERKENPVAALYTNFKEGVGVKNDEDNDQPAKKMIIL